MKTVKHESNSFFLISRILSYLIDVSLSASITLFFFSIGIISGDLFILTSVLISFILWTFLEYLNKGKTIGRELVLNTEVVLSLFAAVVVTILTYPFIPDYILLIFLPVLLFSFVLFNFLDLEQIVMKEKIMLVDQEPMKVVLRNVWKSLAFFFYPLLFADFVSIVFRNRRLIDFAVKNEVKACKK
jgi:hypothetical protein